MGKSQEDRKRSIGTGAEEGKIVILGWERDERPGVGDRRRDSRGRTHLARNSSLVHPGPHAQSVQGKKVSLHLVLIPLHPPPTARFLPDPLSPW